MKVIILNGSPKQNLKECNTAIFINEFMRDMTEKYPVRQIIRAQHHELIEELKEFETILIFIPLYIHAMPGSVMYFFEHLDKEDMKGKNLGFLIQAGFPEMEQEQYVVNYFQNLSKQLDCNYLGTVCKGSAAGLHMSPKNFKRLIVQLNKLGSSFETQHVFDPELVSNLAYRLDDYSFSMKCLLKVTYALGLDNLLRNYILKQTNAYDNQFDSPYL